MAQGGPLSGSTLSKHAHARPWAWHPTRITVGGNSTAVATHAASRGLNDTHANRLFWREDYLSLQNNFA